MRKAPAWTIGSLFSGIGGFERGLELAGLGPTIFQVEKDDFCCAVLEKHWPDVKRYRDVKEVGAHNLSTPFLLVGGFPCTNVSSAGKQEGLAGEHSGLWYEFRRIVGELQPPAGIVENVASGAKLWLCEVREDLHQLGYRTRAYRIFASDVGAPHRRARIFVVAHASGARLEEQRIEPAGDKQPAAQRGRPSGRTREVADADLWRRGRPNTEDVRAVEPRVGGKFDGVFTWVDGCWPAAPGQAQHAWEPARVSQKVPNRPARLKALGNSIVPACAEAIGRVLVGDLNEMRKRCR